MTGRDDGAGSPARPGPDPLAEEAERYRSLFTNHPHGVFSLDLEGYYSDANPACEQIVGFSVEELRGMHFRDVVHPDGHEAAEQAFASVVAGDTAELETRIRHREGHLVEVNLVAMPVCVDEELVGVHGVAEDITDRNRAAAELAAAHREAEEANAAKSLLLANMSHELRTPLTTMLAVAEMLEDLGLDPTAQRFVTSLQRAGGRLRRLIDDILDFSRIEARTVQLRREPFALRTLVEDLVEVVGPVAGAKGLELQVDLDPRLPPALLGDALRVSQVVTNLLDNAVKFTEQGHVALAVSVLAVTDGAVDLSVRVEDTGAGIPDSLAEALFDPFVQGDHSLTRRHDGAGLGLAISSELVRLMGGRLQVDSAPGAGTRITVELTFPVCDPDADPEYGRGRP